MTTRIVFAAAIVIVTASAAHASHSTNAADAFKEANDQMMQNMMAPMSGDADKDFVMMMMPHHQGATDMANIELKYGKDKTLRALAEAIVATQKKEIEEMKKWQAAHP